MRKGNLHLKVRHHRIDSKAGIGKRTTGTHDCTIKSRVRAAVFFLFLAAVVAVTPCSGQDWIKTGTGLGMEKVRLAVPDFKPSTADAQNAALLKVFNDTLWNDLDNAGIFDMVSKSFYPLAVPGTPTDVQFAAWSAPPPNAAMLAFGNLGVTGGNVTVQGWLYDVKNIAVAASAGEAIYRFRQLPLRRGSSRTSSRTKLSSGWAEAFPASRRRRFTLSATAPGTRKSGPWTTMARTSARSRISDQFRYRRGFRPMGRALRSVRLTKIRLGNHDVLDGTQSDCEFPASLAARIFRRRGRRMGPSWHFHHLAQGTLRFIPPDQSGGNLKRITSFKGPDVSPVWNRKTNAQIAWVSGRTGLPQIYTMEGDGTNVQRLTDQGYAVSPAWSPNGQFLAFAWVRHYGPGAPGASDIYLMDVASKQWVQLTHDGGRNDFPSWSPDGRHLVFQSSRAGGEQIWEMLADGSNQKQLTTTGSNTQPNWSWK